MNNEHRVFVYGTLKRGQRAASLMGKHFIGGAVVSGFKMYDLGGFPCCMKSDNPDDVVVGDVFIVDDIQLRKLDAYEGIDNGLFQRIEVLPSLTDSNTKTLANMYIWGDTRDAPKHGALMSSPSNWRVDATNR